MRVLNCLAAEQPVGVPLRLPVGCFRLDTCQRSLGIYFHYTAETTPAHEHAGATSSGGSEAYAFLLRFATGLESKVRGETDVFGQLKSAWKEFAKQESPLGRALAPWMNYLFEDAKAVRAEHLQNVGGNSYGSQAAKLLRKFPEPSARADTKPANESILIVGAGQMACSVAPWLGTATAAVGPGKLRIWNRSEPALATIAAKLRARRVPHEPELLTGDLALREALASARHVVFAIPSDPTRDDEYAEHFARGGADASRALLHLGILSAESAQAQAFRALPGFRALDSLFQSEQAAANEAAFRRALQACGDRASLRFLSANAGASLSLAHGWEDLAGWEALARSAIR